VANIIQRNPLCTLVGTTALSTVAVPYAVGGVLHAVGFRAAGVAASEPLSSKTTLVPALTVRIQTPGVHQFTLLLEE